MQPDYCQEWVRQNWSKLRGLRPTQRPRTPTAAGNFPPSPRIAVTKNGKAATDRDACEFGSALVPGADGPELTYTDNVSAHGACVISNRSWQPGEIVEITSLLDQMTMRGKVVYCSKHSEDRYSIGLSFQNCAAVWSIYLKYAGRAQEAVTVKQ